MAVSENLESKKSVAIELRGLRRTFGEVVAVNNVSLDVYNGEFLTLLGPSGSGKNHRTAPDRWI